MASLRWVFSRNGVSWVHVKSFTEQLLRHAKYFVSCYSCWRGGLLRWTSYCTFAKAAAKNRVQKLFWILHKLFVLKWISLERSIIIRLVAKPMILIQTFQSMNIFFSSRKGSLPEKINIFNAHCLVNSLSEQKYNPLENFKWEGGDQVQVGQSKDSSTVWCHQIAKSNISKWDC